MRDAALVEVHVGQLEREAVEVGLRINDGARRSYQYRPTRRALTLRSAGSIASSSAVSSETSSGVAATMSAGRCSHSSSRDAMAYVLARARIYFWATFRAMPTANAEG